MQVIEFVEKARQGAFIPNEQVMRIAKLFKDELTLANVTRPQLVGMCQYMGLQPYGGDSFLRFQLRAKLRALQDDDRRILWEGIDSLNTIELRDACTALLSAFIRRA
jgi:LETM1 and EF-hand domain-containing protein 1